MSGAVRASGLIGADETETACVWAVSAGLAASAATNGICATGAVPAVPTSRGAGSFRTEAGASGFGARRATNSSTWPFRKPRADSRTSA